MTIYEFTRQYINELLLFQEAYENVVAQEDEYLRGKGFSSRQIAQCTSIYSILSLEGWKREFNSFYESKQATKSTKTNQP